MKNAVALLSVVAALSLLGGCAAQQYRAAPIVPATTAAQFESRRLADPALQSFVEKSVGHPVSPWPPQSWDLQTLALAALYFNPSLEIARARLATADAGMITARERPNPTLDLVPGVPSPYLLTQDILFVIELGGKRASRIQAAQNLDQATQLDLADAGWTTIMGTRLALLNYLAASQNLESTRAEEQVRADQISILQRVLTAGEITKTDVDTSRIELSKTAVAARIAEGQVADAKSALAASIGVPASALDGIQFSWPAFDTPPPAESISPDRIRGDAVLNRLDVRRSLAQYAGAEAALDSEIAKQYPDIHLGPGYTLEERDNFFTIGLSASLPLFNRNQGPIAEAEGRRREAAAVFLQVQTQAIAKTDQALAAYEAALKEVDEAQSVYNLQEAQLQTVQQNVRAGTADQSDLDTIQIQLSILARTRLEAYAHAQQALGDLENALQFPLVSGEMLPVAAATTEQQAR